MKIRSFLAILALALPAFAGPDEDEMRKEAMWKSSRAKNTRGLPFPPVKKAPTTTAQADEHLTDEHLLQCAWRSDGANRDTIAAVARSDKEWEEITTFAHKSGSISANKLEILRQQMISGGFGDIEIDASMLLDWVWGKKNGQPFEQRAVRVKNRQKGYRFDLGDGYVVYLLAKCFNFTMAMRLQANMEVPATLPSPTPTATQSPTPGKAHPGLSPTPTPKTAEPVRKKGKGGLVVGLLILLGLGVLAGASSGGDGESPPAIPIPTPFKPPDTPGGGHDGNK